MSARARDVQLAWPLLDRLIDDEPDQPGDRLLGLSEQTLALREALRRDLEMLLNSRRRFLPLPEAATALDQSLARYGLPDVSHEEVDSGRFRAALPEIIRTAVERFEPRLRDVRIELAPPRSDTDCLLRFQIQAELLVQEGLEPVVFQTSLELLQRLVAVEAARG